MTPIAGKILFTMLVLSGCSDRWPKEGFSAAVLAEVTREQAQRRLGKQALSPTGETLIDRISRGELSATQLLLKAGVPADTTSPEGIPAVIEAVRSDAPGIITALLDAGADVNATAPGGFTAMHMAAHLGRLGCAEALLQADHGSAGTAARRAPSLDRELVDADGNTALLSALRAGHASVALLLVQNGWDPLTAGGDGETALALARKLKDPRLLAAFNESKTPA